MTLTPAQVGFLKGILLVIVAAVVSFLGDAANLNGVVSPLVATIIAGLFSSIESHLKAKSDGSKGLFGAVRVSAR